VSQKRESNANTLHAFLYRTITDLIKTQDSLELESSVIWNTITDSLAGEFIQNKPLSYESSDFGTMSQKEITQTLKDVFGAKPSKRHGSNRSLIFDKSKLERIGKIYDLSIEVKVTDKIELREGKEGNIGTHGTLGTDVGLDKCLSTEMSPVEMAELQGNIDNNSN
jgi:hypothetical protein